MNLNELDLAELRLLRPRVGEVMQERIDARIAELEQCAAPEPPQKRRGRMNQTEAEYAALLRDDPTVARFEFESLKLRLANGTWYTPDFFVVYRDGREQIVEVKGHWRSRDRVRVKVAARLYGWRWTFLAVVKRRRRDGGGWSTETFRGE